MARIAEVAVHGMITAPGKPARSEASPGDLFSALVGEFLTTGVPGVVTDQVGAAIKPAGGDAALSTDAHPSAQNPDIAAALLTAASSTPDTVTNSIVPSSDGAQADAKTALIDAAAIALSGADKPASKPSPDKSDTDDTVDATTSDAAGGSLQTQATPVAVVVPVIVDGAAPAPAPGHSTDLLDAPSRRPHGGAGSSTIDLSKSDTDQTGLDPKLASGSSSGVSLDNSTDAASQADQTTSTTIGAKIAAQDAAQGAISNDQRSAALPLFNQVSAQSGASPKGKTAAASDITATSKAKVDAKGDNKPDGATDNLKPAVATPSQAPDAPSKDGKRGDGGATDAIKTAPDFKPDATAKSTLQQPSAASSNDASTPPALNQILPVTPVQAQLAAVRGSSEAPVPVDGLAVEIAARAKSGKTRFEIRLDPPELGRIDVRLDIDSQGKVSSHLVVDKPETLDLLRRDAPQLQQALNDSGFKTGDGGMQFSLRDQSFTGRNDQGSQGQQRAVPILISEDDTVPAAIAGRSYRMAGAASGIDITV